MTPVGERALLEVSDLSVGFRTRGGFVRAVGGVDLRVREGTTLAVVGESGSGKTATALAIIGLLNGNAAVAGSVMLDGRELLGLDERDWRQVRGKDVAMTFQEPLSALNPLQRVGDQIAEAVMLHEGVGRDQALERAVEVLGLVGISAARRRARELPHQLSGGMRQRVMIAMALSCRPKLLIADEPTTALDVTIQAQILELMDELRRDLQMATVLITHDLGVAAETAHDVAVMYAGRVVESGPVDDVLRRPTHPYSQALLEALPIMGSNYTSDSLRAIPGTVPHPMTLPSGCRFAPRCDRSFDRCSTEPPMFDLGDQESRCWLAEQAAE